MRTPLDRIRHAISFEVLGIAIVTPLAAWVYAAPFHQIGTLALVGATIAGVWNYVFNVMFDRGMLRFRGSLRKTVWIRVLHAAMFEAGLLIALAPYIAWHMGMGLWQAIVMDLSFSLFYFGYAFAFNWGYDTVFPIPDSAAPAGKVQPVAQTVPPGQRGGAQGGERAEPDRA